MVPPSPGEEEAGSMEEEKKKKPAQPSPGRKILHFSPSPAGDAAPRAGTRSPDRATISYFPTLLLPSDTF